jgi:hypothetical protein
MRRYRLQVWDTGNHRFDKYFDTIADANRYMNKKQLPRVNQFYHAWLYEYHVKHKTETYVKSWNKDGTLNSW